MARPPELRGSHRKGGCRGPPVGRLPRELELRAPPPGINLQPGFTDRASLPPPVPPQRAASADPSSSQGAYPAGLAGTPRSRGVSSRPPVRQERQVYLQIERCAGVAEKATSVRIDEAKYAKYSTDIKEGIEQFFDGQIAVEIFDVPAIYCMELRLMPDECHPRHHRAIVGKDAEPLAIRTIFSKIESKKWPKLENVIEQLKALCSVSVRFWLQGKALQARPYSNDKPLAEVHNAAGNQGPHVRTDAIIALQGATIRLSHSQGQLLELHADAEGYAETTLCPGRYHLACEEDGSYDRLTPNSIMIPSNFRNLEMFIMASWKKQCIFSVIDHLNRPFGHFPLRFEPADRLKHPIMVSTKVTGKGRARLSQGVYTVSYGGAEAAPIVDARLRRGPQDWPVETFRQDLEVKDAEIPQYFQIRVHRLKFTCEVLLRTKYQEPLPSIPYVVVASDGGMAASGVSSDIGVIMCDLAKGRYTVKLEPEDDAPVESTRIALEVQEDGSFQPMDWLVRTRISEVQFRLLTPDGDIAPRCPFTLQSQFPENGGGGRDRTWEERHESNENGLASVTINLLEPYSFRIQPNATSDYMPQEFVFQTDKRTISVVVARTVFGTITEDRVAFVLDTSGSMQVYMEDVKAALNLVILKQLRGSSKLFNIIASSGAQTSFRPRLVDCSTRNIEEAMRFCELTTAGGYSNILGGLREAFQLPDVAAIYLVTDGKMEIGDNLVSRVRDLSRSHPCRPKVNPIGINFVLDRLRHRCFQGVAQATNGVCRGVCLEQDETGAEAPGTEFRPLKEREHAMTTDDEAGAASGVEDESSSATDSG